MTIKLTKEKVETIFRGNVIGREIHFLETTTSTNEVALEMALLERNPEGLVIVADSQTRGKGRLGRTWISPEKVNLYFTVLLSPSVPTEEASAIILAAPVAIAKAIKESTGLKARIKWPNDLLIEGKKTCGILTEMKQGIDGKPLLAVGIGINVNMSANELPPDIAALSTSLKEEKNASVDRLDLLYNCLSELDKAYKLLLNRDKGALINEWIRLNCTIGNNVRVQSQDRVIEGIADRINDKGELLITLPSGKTETVRAGDVSIIKN